MRSRTFLSGRAVATATATATATALPGFASAQQASPGIDRALKTVTVGVFTPTTGSVPFCAILSHATASCFNWANETHPLKGWKINCVTCDVGYAPARSVAATRRRVGDNKVFALAAPVGTAQSVAVIPYAKEVGLPMNGAIGGATALFVNGLQMLQASGQALTRVNLVDEVETMSNQRVGGARNVRLKAGEHRGARHEGRVQAAPDVSFKRGAWLQAIRGQIVRRQALLKEARDY